MVAGESFSSPPPHPISESSHTALRHVGLFPGEDAGDDGLPKRARQSAETIDLRVGSTARKRIGGEIFKSLNCYRFPSPPSSAHAPVTLPPSPSSLDMTGNIWIKIGDKAYNVAAMPHFTPPLKGRPTQPTTQLPADCPLALRTYLLLRYPPRPITPSHPIAQTGSRRHCRRRRTPMHSPASTRDTHPIPLLLSRRIPNAL